MTLVENEWGFRCEWCGAVVAKVSKPTGRHFGGPYVGVCEDDGIVTVRPPEGAEVGE